MFEVDIQKALKNCIDFNIYAYDAYFLQSKRFTPLISFRHRMRQVAAEDQKNCDRLKMGFTYSEARQNWFQNPLSCL